MYHRIECFKMEYMYIKQNNNLRFVDFKLINNYLCIYIIFISIVLLLSKTNKKTKKVSVLLKMNDVITTDYLVFISRRL